jgi:hypothetical protein
LRFLCSRGEQEDQQIPMSFKVNPEPRPIIDSKFADVLANRLCVSEVTQSKPAEAKLNARSCLFIAQFSQPTRKDLGLADLDDM